MTCVVATCIHTSVLQVPKLSPYPGSNSVVVMDNCAIHNKQQLTDLLDEQHAALEFLPPYSPDLNPIEQMFKTVKQWLRTHGLQTADLPALTTLELAFNSITPIMCAHWIAFNDCYNVP
jgi:transposase